MQSAVATVEAYLAELPEDRREVIEAIRKVILKKLPKGYEEGMLCGMIGYYVPHSIYPDGYQCTPTDPLPFANLASQKNHMSFYGMGIYFDEEQAKWFVEEWKKTGKKLNMGKSCVRFKKNGGRAAGVDREGDQEDAGEKIHPALRVHVEGQQRRKESLEETIGRHGEGTLNELAATVGADCAWLGGCAWPCAGN